MRKVYVLIHYADYEGSNLECIFSTKRIAEAYIKTEYAKQDWTRMFGRVEEWELNKQGGNNV